MSLTQNIKKTIGTTKPSPSGAGSNKKKKKKSTSSEYVGMWDRVKWYLDSKKKELTSIRLPSQENVYTSLSTYLPTYLPNLIKSNLI